MTPKLFSELGLSEEVLKAIDKLGFEQAAPIQAAAIPLLMAGKDIVGQSQTGSGKTAAFGIPAVEKVDTALRAVQILVLCPTRELAIQVSEEIHKLAVFKRGVNALPIYGGQSYERQFYGLNQGAKIVIGTPGRVMDHMRRGTLRLETVKLVILDEADVMLNMGFRDDIETILKDAPKERQTVFFSATMPRPIRDLIERYARNPENVKVEQKAMTVPTVEQVYYEVDRRFKIELLTRLIDIHDLKLGIIFCNTKRMVDDLVDHLEAQGYMADRLHGDMTQAMRDRVMNKFRKSGLEFLVATDIAARGIDVDDVEVVFNYDLPYDGEDYVHRIGRTGRAGRAGRAITFVSGREVFQIRNIERYTNTRIQRTRVPTEAEVEEARDNVFLGNIRARLQAGKFKSNDTLIERLLEEGFSSTDVAAACLSLLQSGEGSAKPNVEQYDRPQRERRPEHVNFREDRRERHEDRGPRFERPERFKRPQRFENRPPRLATPFAKPPPPPMTSPAPEKTFSDEEILASVKNPEPKAPKSFSPKSGPPRANKKRDDAKPARKPSGATPSNQTRLWMNLGATMDISPIDIVNAVAGETGLSGKVVGAVDVRERHLFVDVASEHAHGIIAKLNRTQIKGHRVKVKVA
jgi:ATP-dependent RNA helicase DeaD